MGEVVNLWCVTRLDLPPNRILESAIDKLESVVIIGYDKDGQEYFASSIADGAEVASRWRHIAAHDKARPRSTLDAQDLRGLHSRNRRS